MSKDYEDDNQNVLDCDESESETINHPVIIQIAIVLVQPNASSIFFYNPSKNLFSLKIQSPPPKL